MTIRYYTKKMLKLFALLGGCILLYLFYMEKDPMEFDAIPWEKNATEHIVNNKVEIAESGEVGEKGEIVETVENAASIENVVSAENDSTTFENGTACLENFAYAAAIQRLSSRPLNVKTVFGVRPKKFDFAFDSKQFRRMAFEKNAGFTYSNYFSNNDYGFNNMTLNQSFGFSRSLLCWCTYCNINLQSM